MNKHIRIFIRVLLLPVLIVLTTTVSYAADKPNILVIWGDDIDQSNISAYTMGLMGYR